MSETSTIGARLRARRRDRNMTQEQLAEASGVSRDLIAKLEQERRQSARVTTLTKLANALDVDLSDLIGKRERIGSTPDGARVLALRNALISPSYLPTVEAQDEGEPPSVAEMHAAVDAAADLYWKGDFGALLARLPGLIAEARLAYAQAGVAAIRPLALAYDLGASLMVHFGRDDLAAIGAERAIVTAHGGDDELLWATMHGTYSWVLLHQARLGEAEELSSSMAARIEPSFSADSQRVAAWGNLLMTAVAPAAAARRDVSQYINLASAGAERLGTRVNLFNTTFGHAKVAAQATHAYTVLHEPGSAMKAAKKIRPGDLRGIDYGRHLLDFAQAQMDARYRRSALETLQKARDLSPVWFRHQGVARSLVREIREEEMHPSPAIRSLSKTLGIES